MQKNKNTLVVDGYWNTNLGDDLFLKILCDHYHEVNFTIAIDKRNYNVFKNIQNLSPTFVSANIQSKIINKIEQKTGKIISSSFSRRNKIRKLISEFNTYIELGGSLFELPKTGMGADYSFRKVFRKNANNYLILGSSFGPYYHQYHIDNYNVFFDTVEDVVFRDKESYDLFKKNKNKSLLPDFVFNLNKEKYNTKNKNYVLFSIINPSINKSNYKEFIKKYIKYYSSRNIKVVLMSFCENQGDLSYIYEICNELDDDIKNNVIIKSHHDIEESVQLIANALSIVATRYHAMILAWIFEKPCFVISYHKKIRDAIYTYNPSQKFVSLDKVCSTTTMEFGTPVKMDEWRKKSAKYFEKLDKIMI